MNLEMPSPAEAHSLRTILLVVLGVMILTIPVVCVIVVSKVMGQQKQRPSENGQRAENGAAHLTNTPQLAVTQISDETSSARMNQPSFEGAFVPVAAEVGHPFATSPAEAKWLPLQRLWAAKEEERVPQVRWWIADQRLIWEMKTALPLADRATFKTEGFIEGLWEQDVAEFFLMDRETGRYQEYNLSPGGAWWAATFSTPRVRVEPQPESAAFGVSTVVVWTETEWIGRFSLPLPETLRTTLKISPSGSSGNHSETDRLREALQRGRIVVNFTAISTGHSGKRFYSLAALGGAVPDFHQPGTWIPW